MSSSALNHHFHQQRPAMRSISARTNTLQLFSSRVVHLASLLPGSPHRPVWLCCPPHHSPGNKLVLTLSHIAHSRHHHPLFDHRSSSSPSSLSRQARELLRALAA
eukprot:10676945-Karenia_brevis.AAC.2